MSKVKTIKATPDNPEPQPPHGGDWRREANGDLTLVQATAPEAAPPPTPAPAPTPAASGKQPPKE